MEQYEIPICFKHARMEVKRMTMKYAVVMEKAEHCELFGTVHGRISNSYYEAAA